MPPFKLNFGYFPKDYFPSDNFPSGNFPIPKARLGYLRCSRSSAAARTDLGICTLYIFPQILFSIITVVFFFFTIGMISVRVHYIVERGIQLSTKAKKTRDMFRNKSGNLLN